MRCYVGFIVWITTSLFISAQCTNLIFDHITVKDGLPYDQMFYAIEQDYKGFLWFGTENGLHKFDGYEFVSYYKIEKDSTSISGKRAHAVFEDSKNRLWVGCVSGFNRYNHELDNFTRIPLYTCDTIYYCVPRTIIETKDQQILVGLSHWGICRYDEQKQALMPLELSIEGLGPENIGTVNTILEDHEERLWIATDKMGIYVISRDHKSYYRFCNDPQADYPLSSNHTYCIMQDRLGFIWVTTSNGLSRIDPLTNGVKFYQHDPSDRYSISFDILWRIYEDDNGNIWLTTDGGGLNYYERDKDRFIHFEHDPADINTLLGNKTNVVFVDNQNNLWVNSLGKGLNFTNLDESRSKIVLTHKVLDKNSLSYDQISSILEDGHGNLWIGTDGGGLNYYNRQSGDFLHYRANREKSGHLHSDAILALFIDPQNTLWVGTYKGGLSKFNQREQQFYTFAPDNSKQNSPSSNDIREISMDKNKNLLIATCGGGLNIFDPKTGKFTYHRKSDGPDMLSNDYCETLYLDSRGYLWIGTYYGLSRYHIDTGSFSNYFNNPNDSTSLSNHTVYSIFEDSDNNIWVGTLEGLNRYIFETNNFVNYLKEDGLSSDAIFGILEDEAGNLWISTDAGLNKFNVSTGEIFAYRSNIDPMGQSFKPGAFYKTSRGEMVFGGNNGLVIFDPKEIAFDTTVPKIYLTDFQVKFNSLPINKDNSPLKKHISHTCSVTLRHNQSFISIVYAGLKFYNAKNLSYAYILQGFEENWHFVGSERKATYTRLEPGKYIFRVKASPGNNMWGGEETSLQIIILPPWWEKLWFKAVLLAIFLITVFSLYFMRISSLKRQQKILESMVRERTFELEERQIHIEQQSELLQHKSNELENKNIELEKLNITKDKLFSILAHDLRNPFSTILGFAELMLDRYNELDNAVKLHYVQLIYSSAKNTFSLLENLLLWSLSQTKGIKIKPRHLSLAQLIDENVNLMNNQLIEKEISVSRHYEGDIKIFADRYMINSVIQNLLTNAIKFTEAGNIDISVFSRDKEVFLIIKDSGVGMSQYILERLFEIDKSKSANGTRGEKGTGLGLVLCKEFINIHNGFITIESKEGKGSKFIVSFPVAKD